MSHHGPGAEEWILMHIFFLAWLLLSLTSCSRKILTEILDRAPLYNPKDLKMILDQIIDDYTFKSSDLNILDSLLAIGDMDLILTAVLGPYTSSIYTFDEVYNGTHFDGKKSRRACHLVRPNFLLSVSRMNVPGFWQIMRQIGWKVIFQMVRGCATADEQHLLLNRINKLPEYDSNCFILFVKFDGTLGIIRRQMCVSILDLTDETSKIYSDNCQSYFHCLGFTALKLRPNCNILVTSANQILPKEIRMLTEKDFARNLNHAIIQPFIKASMIRSKQLDAFVLLASWIMDWEGPKLIWALRGMPHWIPEEVLVYLVKLAIKYHQ